MVTRLPFWLSYSDATFDPKPLGFDIFHIFNHSPIATGLGCPFCHQGIYRAYGGQLFITCDNHHLKQSVAFSSEGQFAIL